MITPLPFSLGNRARPSQENNKGWFPEFQLQILKAKRFISPSAALPFTLLFALDGLAKKFGLTPEQFGENLRDSYQRHETEQFPAEPLELAKDYVCR